MGNKKNSFQVLTKRSDFLNLKINGYRVHPQPWMTLNFKKNELGILRCGWTVPRQVGIAVIRNRLKRWSREYFRSFAAKDTENVAIDINVVFRPFKDNFYKEIRKTEFNECLDKALRMVRKKL